MEVFLLTLAWFLIILIGYGIAKSRKINAIISQMFSDFLGFFGIAYALIAKARKSIHAGSENNIDKRIQHFENLRNLKDEELISEEEFDTQKTKLKQVIIAPVNYEYITIKHVDGIPEVISRQAWNEIKKKFGCSNYIILSYH